MIRTALKGLFATALTCGVMSATQAQTLGNAFSYQGQLKESGQPATGLYDFQACLFDSLVSAAPLICAPDIGDVPVADGLFTVALDFGAATFSGQQRFLELRVRPGASIDPYTVLNPRQLLRATPEALRANTTPWTGLTAMPTGFIDGIDNVGVSSVSAGAGLAGGPITTTGALAIATGGVTNTMIATDAIDSVRIVNDSVGVADIGANAVMSSELADNSVDTQAIVDANVTTAKIAPGAVGAAQIDVAQVQTRITGSCGDGEYFRGINIDGTLDCELLPVKFDRVLDSVGDVGKFVAMAIRNDDRPVLAYHENSNGSLRLYDCADPVCASGTRRTLDSAGDVGEDISIAIRPNGFPVVAYRDVSNLSLKLYDCNNVACTTGSARILDDTINVNQYLSMALRTDGRPFIVYYDSLSGLHVYDCDNVTCSSGQRRALPGGVPTGTSVAIRADGRPLIVIGGNAGAATSVRVFDCNDVACSAGVLRTLTPNTSRYPVSMVLRNDGRPFITMYGTTSTLTSFDCSDADCTSASFSVLDAEVTDQGGAVKLRSNGNLLIAFGRYLSVDEAQVRLFDCTNAACTAGSNRLVIEGGNFGQAIALGLRSDGRPVLAFYDELNQDLRLRICANPECT